MPDVHINDGGTWRTASEVFINDNGTWREAKEIWINDNGTFRQVFVTTPLVLDIPDFTALSIVSSPSSAQAVIRVDSDGKLYRTNGGTSVIYYSDWVSSLTEFTNSDYEVRASYVSGIVPVGTLNTWQPISSDRQWSLNRTANGVSTSVIDITIREIANSANFDTFRVTLTARVEAGF